MSLHEKPLPKWNKTATVGLVFILAVAALAAVAVSSAVKRKKDIPVVPDVSATDVELPPAQLSAVESMISPLLKTDVAAFSDLSALNEAQAAAAVLNELANASDGAVVSVAREEFDAGFIRLFGRLPQDAAVRQAAEYDAESGVCRYTVDGYHPEYAVSILSIRTLSNTVYVTAQAVKAVEPESEFESVSESDPESESEAEPSVGSGDSASASDTETVSGTQSDEPAFEPESATPSDPQPEIEYETVKTAVFTLQYDGAAYHIIALRYI